MNTAVLTQGGTLVSRRLAETARLFVQRLPLLRYHYAVALLSLFLAIAASHYAGRPFELRIAILFTVPILMICGVFVFAMLVREFVRHIRSRAPGSVSLALLVYIRDELLAPGRITNILHTTLFMSIFMTGFVSIKSMLPDINPFSWDPTFWEWDRAVHFGLDPWRILQPVLGYPLVTSVINFAYNSWFFVLFGGWIWQGFGKSLTPLQRRYLLAFCVTWLLGTSISGVIFASGGPCYYGKLVAGPDPYLPLMDYLNRTAQIVPVWALDVQAMLWESYKNGGGPVAGISAMPSMHVGTCVLLTLLGFATGKRWLGWAFAIFAIVIFLGSIHLAWHYAIDGYAGAAIALFAWWLAGGLVDRPEAREMPRVA